MTTFHGRDDILAMLIHLGYLEYDMETKEVPVPNKEIFFGNRKQHGDGNCGGTKDRRHGRDDQDDPCVWHGLCNHCNRGLHLCVQTQEGRRVTQRTQNENKREPT